MSIEIVLHPKNATRNQLQELLVSHEFTPTDHLWDWPEGSVHYYWFDHEDYRSFAGVEATIFAPSDKEDLSSLGHCNWALHTRTRLGASPADITQQNDIVRAVRQKFGGNFYNDWHGKNRYTPVPQDFRDAADRGIYLAYELVTQNIRAVRYALPEPQKDLENLVGTKLEVMANHDPARVLYNALIPFAVAVLEHFFSQCFKILLHYEPQARSRLLQQTRKIEVPDVLAIKEGTKTIEDVVANWYSFQNISSIHNAFSDWFKIDFWNLIRRRRKIGKRIPFLETKLNELISARHGIVHGLFINVELRKDQIREILDLTIVVMDVFVDHLEKERGKSIRD